MFAGIQGLSLMDLAILNGRPNVSAEDPDD